MRGPRQATYSWSTQPAWSRRGRRTGRMITRDPLGTWETLPSPSLGAGRSPVDQLQDDPQSGPRLWGRTGDKTMVSRAREGNEVRREGRQGVGASRSTDEPGEPPRTDPEEGRRRRLMNRWRETCQVHRDLRPCPRNNDGSRNSPGTLRICPSRPCASHRHRLVTQSLCSDPQGRSCRRGRTDRGGIRGQPEGQP